MKLYPPKRHRPVETCGECGAAWPCQVERWRLAGAAASRRATERALGVLTGKTEERTEGDDRG